MKQQRLTADQRKLLERLYGAPQIGMITLSSSETITMREVVRKGLAKEKENGPRLTYKGYKAIGSCLRPRDE